MTRGFTQSGRPAAGPDGSAAVITLDSARPLAHRPDFQLGQATIRPSLRRIDGPGGSASIEPRILRVLLALADSRGRVLGREDLIRACWDGLIVGDDAIHRAISSLRRIAAKVDGGFTIETIPRVGYRIADQLARADDADDSSESAVGTARLSRRQSIATGIAALGVAAAGAFVLWPREDPRAAALLLRGEQALRDGMPDSASNGVAFLREAVSLAPGDPRAWGLLSLALRDAAENAPPNQTASLVTASDDAAGHALGLDPREPNALAARATLMPAYGDWLAAEDRLRAVLAVARDHAWSLASLGYLMESVGRSRESAALTKRAAEIEPLSPVFQFRLAYKYWAIGKAVQSDQVIDRAMLLWPRHPGVVMARLLLFVWTGRYGLARGFLSDAENQRVLMPQSNAPVWRLSIDALEFRRPADVAAVRNLMIGAAKVDPGAAIVAIQTLSLLDQLDDAFSIANGYLLRRGPAAGALRADDGRVVVNDQRWRKTVMLFIPSTVAMRRDSRFSILTRDMGLQDYWRHRGVGPDYLRTA